MPRSHYLIFIISLFTLFPLALSGCQSSGYSQKTWTFNTPSPAPAQSPPKQLEQETTINAQTPNQTTALQTLPTTKTVKVAILLPLSGKHKQLGDSMLKAAQIAMFDIGLESFELIPQDTKGTPEGARTAARSAVQSEAKLILGPLFSESVRAAKPIAARENINLIAFSTDWSLAGGNAFIMGFLPFDQVERLTGYIAAKNLGRVGVFAPDTEYGNAVSSAFSRLATRYGVEITANTSFPARTSNLAPALRSFTKFDERKNLTNGAKPFEAVLMPVGGDQASTIANLLSHYDLPPRSVKRLGTGLFDDRSLSGETNLNGAWFAAPAPDSRRPFEQKYIATFGTSAPRLASLAYDATALAAVLAQRGNAQNGSPSFTRADITNPNGFYGIDGIFRFRPDGTAERGLAILEFKRGRTLVIDPAPKTFQQPIEY